MVWSQFLCVNTFIWSSPVLTPDKWTDFRSPKEMDLTIGAVKTVSMVKMYWIALVENMTNKENSIAWPEQGEDTVQVSQEWLSWRVASPLPATTVDVSNWKIGANHPGSRVTWRGCRKSLVAKELMHLGSFSRGQHPNTKTYPGMGCPGYWP